MKRILSGIVSLFFLLLCSYALSKEAEQGLRIFQGKGRCAEYHDGVLLTNDRFSQT